MELCGCTRRYKRLVDAVFPHATSDRPDAINQGPSSVSLSLSLSHPSLSLSVSVCLSHPSLCLATDACQHLTFYALHNPAKLPKVGRYLTRRFHRAAARSNHRCALPSLVHLSHPSLSSISHTHISLIRTSLSYAHTHTHLFIHLSPHPHPLIPLPSSLPHPLSSPPSLSSIAL